MCLPIHFQPSYDYHKLLQELPINRPKEPRPLIIYCRHLRKNTNNTNNSHDNNSNLAQQPTTKILTTANNSHDKNSHDNNSRQQALTICRRYRTNGPQTNAHQATPHTVPTCHIIVTCAPHAGRPYEHLQFVLLNSSQLFSYVLSTF